MAKLFALTLLVVQVVSANVVSKIMWKGREGDCLSQWKSGSDDWGIYFDRCEPGFDDHKIWEFVPVNEARHQYKIRATPHDGCLASNDGGNSIFLYKCSHASSWLVKKQKGENRFSMELADRANRCIGTGIHRANHRHLSSCDGDELMWRIEPPPYKVECKAKHGTGIGWWHLQKAGIVVAYEESWESGIDRTKQDGYSTTWTDSVTRELSGGFELKGLSIGGKISSESGTEIVKSSEQSWSEGSTHKVTQKFDEDTIGFFAGSVAKGTRDWKGCVTGRRKKDEYLVGPKDRGCYVGAKPTTTTTTTNPRAECNAVGTKINCGYSGMNKGQCEAKACCWEATGNKSIPYCFYSKILPKDCAADKYPVDVKGVQCMGLSKRNPTTAGDCQSECCKDSGCEVWQFCEKDAQCDQPGSCFVGKKDRCFENNGNQTGWIGRARDLGSITTTMDPSTNPSELTTSVPVAPATTAVPVDPSESSTAAPVDPSPEPVHPTSAPADEATTTPTSISCPPEDFPFGASGHQCTGLLRIGVVNSQEECASKCCADPNCKVWQFCPEDATGCDPKQCFVGDARASEVCGSMHLMLAEGNETGLVGRRQDVSTTTSLPVDSSTDPVTPDETPTSAPVEPVTDELTTSAPVDPTTAAPVEPATVAPAEPTTGAPPVPSTQAPTVPPTEQPTLPPTAMPTVPPAEVPTDAPTLPPTETPTVLPTEPPTVQPTSPPTEMPTMLPTEVPTDAPIFPPTEAPTAPPTEAPTETPHVPPTVAPSVLPTEVPTMQPTVPPTVPPTEAPTDAPTLPPTETPTAPPTEVPTEAPTVPTEAPTVPPTEASTVPPTEEPTLPPTEPATAPMEPTTTHAPVTPSPQTCQTCLTSCAPCKECEEGPDGSFGFGSCKKCWSCWDWDDDELEDDDDDMDDDCDAMDKDHDWDDDEVRCLTNDVMDCRACWSTFGTVDIYV